MLVYGEKTRTAVSRENSVLIGSENDALDLIADVYYNLGCEQMVLSDANFSPEFFDLKTKLAGGVLQKFTNYHMKLAIVGIFDKYNSKSLNDFIYECNKGNDIFFVENTESALLMLKTDHT